MMGEYDPSPAELMLGETGEGIRQIIAANTQEEINSILDRHNIKTNQLNYRKFSFIHFDVMGSGLFFYVEDIEEITVHLRGKEQE